MSTITLADFGALLKEVVEPVIQDQLFRDNVFLSQIQRNKSIKIANGEFKVVATAGAHSGVYSVAEGATIEDGAYLPKKMTVDAKYTYGRHTFTDVSLEGIEGDEGSVANLLATATDELKMELQKDAQRQMVFGFGQGVLGTVSTGVTGTTITVEDGSVTGDNMPGTEHIREGQKILIGTKSEVEAGTADAVTVVNVLSNTQFTVSSSITVVDGDVIVKAGVYSNSAYNEMAGVRNLLDNASSPYDTTFQGITRATSGWVNGFVRKGSAETLTIARITEYYLQARKYGKPNLILMGSKLYAKYIALLDDKKRYVDIKVGMAQFTGVEFAGGAESVPVVLDYDMPPEDVYILDTTTWTIGEMAPPSFVDRDGQILRNVGGNSANFSAIMKHYANLVLLKPRGNARLESQTA